VDLSVNLNSVFADHEGPFVERVERAAAAGADAVGVFGRDPDEVARIADAADAHGLAFAYASSLVGPTNDPDAIDERVDEVREALELADECGVELLNVSPDDDRAEVDDADQFGAVVEVCRRSAPAAADAGVDLLLEPLNPVDHHGSYLTTAVEGFKLLTAVDHGRVNLLFDVYHEQVAAGNVTASLVGHLDEVGHVHVADVPGRGEPGTGELDYPSIVAALDDAGYDGYLGCEFWPEGDPEAAVERVAAML